MEPTIAEFLSTAASLHQHIIEAREDQRIWNTPSTVATHMIIVQFASQFERLGRILTSAASSTEIPAPHQKLAKNCWKLSQDLLIRLRQIEHVDGQVENPERDATAATIQSVFSEHDLDNLNARLYELKELWDSARLGSDSLQEIAIKLPKKNLTADVKRNGTDRVNEELNMLAKGIMGMPSRTASSGLLMEFILESLSYNSMRNREEEVAEAHNHTFEWIFSREKFTDEAKVKIGDDFVKWLGGNDLGSIYWITGKPGSGKSTLMRYLSDHGTTNELLRSWAGDSMLVRANFYFWTSGSYEQRSQTGLLRYLLYQLLDFDRGVIPSVFPDLWEKLSKMTTKERIKFTIDWTSQELMEAFRRFIDSAVPTSKIFLFVDGLDEFDGDHKSIIRFFKDLVEGENRSRIKVCLSSRPWEVFEKAFETSVPNLKLQDLTFQDMYAYANDYLQSNEHLRKILRQDITGMETLIKRTTRRADGVFLWVRLVVSNILKVFGGPANTLQEINTFVSSLPTDLEELFTDFLFINQSQDKISKIAHIFQLMRAREVIVEFIQDESADSLTIREMSFALDATDDILALKRSPKEASDIEIRDRCHSTRDLIIDSSVGLLEIYPCRPEGRNSKVRLPKKESIGKTVRKLAAHRVTYLHRTVRDYLMLSPGIWERLVSHSAADFDPNLRLLRSYVLRLKFPLEEIEQHRRHDEWWPDIALALTHARHIDPIRDSRHLQTSLINELDSTISSFWAKRPGDLHDHWARSNFGTYETRKGNKMFFPDPFLALCTKFGLEIYVIDRLETIDRSTSDISVTFEEEFGSNLIVEQTPLLSYALEFLTNRQKTIYPLSSQSFVQALLDLERIGKPGIKRLIGNPNLAYNSPLSKLSDVTPWIVTLRHLRDGKRRSWIQSFDIEESGTERWAAIVRLLIEEGRADKSAIVKADAWDPEVDAKGVVVRIIGDIGDHWITELGKCFED